jgi:hypothetical protein
MGPMRAGDLVTISGDGPSLDAIVFDTPSNSKVVVAVMDSRRGPVLRTVHPRDLTERSGAGPHDAALRLLLRRTPQPERGKAKGGRAGGQGRAGYTRSARHRSTGR